MTTAATPMIEHMRETYQALQTGGPIDYLDYLCKGLLGLSFAFSPTTPEWEEVHAYRESVTSMSFAISGGLAS